MARKFTKYPSSSVTASVDPHSVSSIGRLPICRWVNTMINEGVDIQMPIQLEIGIDKISSDGMTRYMTTRIAGQNVTSMVANAIHCKTSRARDTSGDLVVSGCGMDMGFYVQNSLYHAACRAGYPDMFDEGHYKYLGKRSCGRYPYAD